MERIVLVASKGMIFTDFETWGTKIYLSEDKEKETYFEVPMENYIKALEALTEHNHNNF